MNIFVTTMHDVGSIEKIKSIEKKTSEAIIKISVFVKQREKNGK